MDEPLAVARRYMDLGNEDVDRWVDECTAADYSMVTDGRTVFSSQSEAKLGMREILRIMPDAYTHSTLRFSVGNAVAMSIRTTGTVVKVAEGYPPVGQQTVFEGVAILLVDGDRVATEYIYSGTGEGLRPGGRTPEETARWYWDTYNLGTDAFVDKCLTADARFLPEGKPTLQSRDEWHVAAQDVLRLMPDRQVEPKVAFAVGNVVCARLRVMGTFAESRPGMPPAGQQMSKDYVIVLEVRDGRIAAEHGFSGDPATLDETR
jgi:ketosteroid isomerase-like protein